MDAIPDAQQSPTERQRFPRRAYFAAAAIAAAGALAALVVFLLWPSGGEDARWVSVGSVEDYEVFAPARVSEHEIWLVRLPADEFVAVSEHDPTSGCAIVGGASLDLSGLISSFEDPCGGSQYDLDGVCFAGPCVAHLQRFEVRVQSGQVQVDLAPGDDGD